MAITVPHQPLPCFHLPQRPLPSLLPLFPHRTLLSSPLLFLNQTMEEEPPPSSNLPSPSPELRRRTMEIDTGELLHLGFIFFLGARSFPKLFLHLPQAPSKEDKLELHQALTTIFKTLLV